MDNNNKSNLDDAYNWSPEYMLEVILPDPDSFLKIKETLTRIGIASKRDNSLFQSAHILHKRGKYYIVSFLELFALDGRSTSITYNDVARRNTIANLLHEWGLCTMIRYAGMQFTDINTIKIIPYKEKSKWNLVPKYTIGSSNKKKLI